MQKVYFIYSILSICILTACSKEKNFQTQEFTYENTGDHARNAAQYLKLQNHSYYTPLPKYLNVLGMENVIPDDDKIALGRVLFYDKNLSSDRSISCASCHKQELAFGDNAQFSKGVGGELTTRHSMALANVAHFGAHYRPIGTNAAPSLLWDGRASNVATQAPMAFTNPHEMNMTMEGIVQRVETQPYYPYFFERAYGDLNVSKERITECLEHFVGAIGASSTRIDAVLEQSSGNLDSVLVTQVYYGDGTSTLGLDIAEARGREIFVKNCSNCHSPVRPLQKEFMACNGLDLNDTDKGLGGITGRPQDMGVFKSPSLRNIAFTAPYMHDGRFNTLEEVIDFYSKGVQNHPNLHTSMRHGNSLKLNLNGADRNNLIAFLHTFTDKDVFYDGRFSNPFIQ